MKFRAVLARTVSILAPGMGALGLLLILFDVVPGAPRKDLAIVSGATGAVWFLSAIWLSWLLRPRDRSSSIIPGLLIIAATLGLIWAGPGTALLSSVYPVLATACLGLVYGYILAPTLLLTSGLLYGSLFLWIGDRDLAQLIFVVTIPVSAVCLWIKVEFREWARQARLFDQARWAASEFVTVNTRMQDNLDRAAGLTRMRERVRVAREIHDTVGYTLTAVLVQIHAAEEVLKANPAELPPRLEQLSDMVRGSIQEVRREVSSLRDESVVERAGTSRWQRLCEGFADSTGIRVHTNLSGDLEEVDPAISEAIYRLIQESLTNAYRHGSADYVDVSMSWELEQELILLRVSDNGKGAMSLDPGNGLTGMRERVAELGGDVVWQTSPGRGFDIGVDIPWERGANGED